MSWSIWLVQRYASEAKEKCYKRIKNWENESTRKEFRNSQM